MTDVRYSLPQACVLLTALLPTAAFAEGSVEELLEVDPNGAVLVHCVRGDVSIVGWERPEVRVTGELDDLAKGLTFERKGSETRIILRLARDGGVWGDGADLEIYVPSTSTLRVNAISADVEIEAMSGAVAARTVSGDIEASTLGQLTRFQTTSGDIEVSGAEGILQVMTTSGDVRLDVSAREVSVDTVSGEADVELEAFEAARLSTINGELELEGSLSRGGKLSASSTNGEIEIRLEEPVHATADVRAGPGGSIDNELSDAEPVRKPAGYRLALELGDGSGNIQLKTVNGSIRLEPK